MNVVGNYALVRKVCLHLLAGNVVRADWKCVGAVRIVNGRPTFASSRVGTLAFCAVTEPRLPGVAGKTYADAYEAAVAFVRGLEDGERVRVPV